MEGGGVWGINEVLGGEEERKGEKDEKKSSDGSHQLNFIEVRWVQTIAEQTLLRGVKTHTHTHTQVFLIKRHNETAMVISQWGVSGVTTSTIKTWVRVSDRA